MRSDGSFQFKERRIAYSEYGAGERTIVVGHGLLMNRLMYSALAPELASRGYRVVTIDFLGHGDSDQPHDMRAYSNAAFADQEAALIDYLELDRPVVGGTSLGANVALELAARHPGKARGLLIEMPVLDNALLAAGLIFLPALLGMRTAKPLLRLVAAVTNRIPRSHFLVDVLLDWTRRDPNASEAVLEGLLFGRAAPPREEREAIDLPALIVGHPADPLHPFSDSDMLCRELPNGRLVNASSPLEWRIRPQRLNGELASFLDEVYAGELERSEASTAA